jgi:hypothetical protein
VRSTGIERRNNSPFRIEPHLGQITDNSVKPPNSEHWAVFHECKRGLYLAYDPCKLGPQSTSFSGNSGTFSGRANILTWKAARNHVNNSAPRLSVKSSHVIPNWERSEASVILPCDKYIAGVFIEFDCADGFPSEQLAAEYSATSAREKSQLIHIAFLFAFAPRTGALCLAAAL